jgi:hypothetical protein
MLSLRLRLAHAAVPVALAIASIAVVGWKVELALRGPRRPVENLL